jgi:hypothetical protein
MVLIKGVVLLVLVAAPIVLAVGDGMKQGEGSVIIAVAAGSGSKDVGKERFMQEAGGPVMEEAMVVVG